MTNEIIIVDSALFKKPLSDKALSFLKEKTVMISPSFYHEAEAYAMVLDKTRTETLRNNISCLLKASKHGAYLVSSPTAFDMFTAAVASTKQGKKICVMTEDALLIERLRMRSTLVSIYNLNTDCLEMSKPLSRACHVEHTLLSAAEVSGVFNMQGSILKNELGDWVTLSNRLSEESNQDDYGMESAVYDIVGQPDFVAKIYRYHPSLQKQEHLKKLKTLGGEMNLSWCLLPQSLLYKDGKLIGFTMHKKKVKMLSDDTLYLGNEQIIEHCRLSVRKSYTISFAITMLAQIKILNCYGVSICDYNPNNFSMYYANTPVAMFDTDSFILDSYYSNSIDDTAAFTRSYKHDDKLELLQMVAEEALIFVFRLLSLGANPIIRTGYPYVFSNPNSLLLYRRSYFPVNTERYLEKVFTGNSEPSISLLLYELLEAMKELQLHTERDITAERMIEAACEKDEEADHTNIFVDVKTIGAAKNMANAAQETEISASDQVVSVPAKTKSNAVKWFVRAAAIAALCIGVGFWLTSTGILQL